MREKLIELLDRATEKFRFDAWENTDKIADFLIANGVTIPVRCKDCSQEGWCYLRQEMGADGFCSAAIDKNLTIGERVAEMYRRQDEIDFDYEAEDV